MVANLGVDGGPIATASYQVVNVGGQLEVELEVEVEDAQDGSYNVKIDGTSIGNIVVDGGTGAIQFSNEADGDQVAFPANFPGVEAGSTIIIDGLFSAGTFS